MAAGLMGTERSAVTWRPKRASMSASRSSMVTPSALASAATSAMRTAAVMPSLSRGGRVTR